jgi:hypothetical protein
MSLEKKQRRPPLSDRDISDHEGPRDGKRMAPPLVEASHSDLGRPSLIGKGSIVKDKKGKERLESRALDKDPKILDMFFKQNQGLESAEIGESSGIPAGLLDNNAVYRFRLSTWTSVSSSAGGTIALALSLSPSVTTFPAWASLSALFQECRLVNSTLTILNNDPFYTVVSRTCAAVAYDDQQSSTAPTSVNNVYAIANAKIHPMGSPERHVYTAKAGSREWAKSSTPAPAVYAGMYGQWSIYQTSLSAATAYFNVFMEAVVDFRTLQS